MKKLQNSKRTSSDPFKQDEEDGGKYTEVLYNFNSSGYQEAVTGVFGVDNVFTVKA